MVFFFLISYFFHVIAVEKLQPYENREETHQDDVFTETEEETVLKSHGKTTAGNTTVGNTNLTNLCSNSKNNRIKSSVNSDGDVFEECDNAVVNGTSTTESKKARRLQMSSSLPETDLRNDSVDDMSNHQAAVSVKPRRRSVSSVSDEKQSNEKWSRPKSSASSTQQNESLSKNMPYSGKQTVYHQPNGHSSKFRHPRRLTVFIHIYCDSPF